MFERHVIRRLTAFHHGEISGEEKLQVETHLQVCVKCRTTLDEIRFAGHLASRLSVSTAPATLRSDLQPVSQNVAPVRRARRAVLVGLAAGVLLLVVLFTTIDVSGPSWQVTGVPGLPQLRPGEALETGSEAEARVKIADIGELTVDRNTRIRLLVTQSDQHRMALDRGRVEAVTWAPPRLFIVETPSATAIDLGCRYTLEVEKDGGSLLHVTQGLVALERDGLETIVPAGAFCRTRSGSGPGTPFFEDSSADFQSALAFVDSATQGPERVRQLEIVLSEAGIRDALSLWHLLPRLDPRSRGLIHDRLAQLMPPPPEVTREGIVSLDPKMIDAWKKIVSQLWQ